MKRLLAFLLLVPCLLRAQSWEAEHDESFGCLTSPLDAPLSLLRSRCDILLSTDSGLTWHEAYHGLERIDTLYQAEDGAIVAVLDSETAIVSRDTGRTWRRESGEWKAERTKLEFPASLYPLPAGTHSVTYANSLYYAVGTPGLICVSDRSYTHWKELHRAPFPRPPGSPAGGSPAIDFFTASDGMIVLGSEIYFTHDSATSWSRTVLRDTATASLMISRNVALVAARGKPHDTSAVSLSIVRCGVESQLQPQLPIYRPVLQLGWANRMYSTLYLLTDSAIYFADTSLQSMTVSVFPLQPGEHAIYASFPDPYTAYVLADSITRRDTTLEIDNAWIDTTLVFDTCTIYRSTDGGMSWYPTLQHAVGLSKLFFTNAGHGFACGKNGIIMRTDDSGSHWGRWGVPQDLHDIRFINDSVGYVVGDSGAVYFTQSAGRWWRASYPVPGFSHPTSSYTSIAFADASTVYIVANDACYRQHIPDPVPWRFQRRGRQRNPIAITASPNPSNGGMHFDVKLLYSANTSQDNPSIQILDFAGRVVYNTIECVGSAPNEWSANADLSNLTTGVYVAIASLGSTTAKCNFVIAH